MELGIFAKTFVRSSLAETLDAVKAHRLDWIQFNMSCAGLSLMPARIAFGLAADIRKQVLSRELGMSAVSGTFNMAHPDERSRKDGLRRLRVLASVAKEMGTSVITLCTGTRDRENMWRSHPDNRSAEAWKDMKYTVSQAMRIAEEFDVTMAIEPERSNIVNNARMAKRLLDEIGSPRLRIVMDAANLYECDQTAPMNEIMDEAFELLGGSIVIAHAKDISSDSASDFVAAGKGKLDYVRYIKLLQKINYNGALILHGLFEDQVAESVRFLREMISNGEGVS